MLPGKILNGAVNDKGVLSFLLPHPALFIYDTTKIVFNSFCIINGSRY